MAKYVTLTLFCIIILFPMYWMVSGSFQDSRGIMAMPPRFFPTEPVLDNYRWILTYTPGVDTRLWRAVLNSLIAVTMAITLHIAVSFSAGYVFALYEFRGKEALFWLLIMAMSVGRYQLILPHYILVSKLGLVNTLFGTVLPLVFAPMSIFFFRNYLLSIPKSLVDSARMDGAGEIRILARILVPMCKPVAGVLSLLCGLSVVGDYIWPSLVLQFGTRRTIYVEMINRMRDPATIFSGLNRIGVQLAAGTLLLIPMIAIFALTSRYIIDGLKTGGVKE